MVFSELVSPVQKPVVTLSECPAVCWATRLLPAPFRSWMPAGLGPKTRVVTERLPTSPVPLTRAPVAKCPENLEDGSIGPKYPDLNRRNEHKYIILVKALFCRESTGTSRSLLPSPRTCLKVWTGSHRWQSPSRPPRPVALAAG